MARVTSKLQVTIPKLIANQYGIEPGAEIAFLPAGDAIRVVPTAAGEPRMDATRRLRLFDAATERQKQRESHARRKAPRGGRGWTREELYRRGIAG